LDCPGRLIKQAAAVVCHGGYGSVLGALSLGGPVVALAIFSNDQWRNAGRVAELGAGVALDGDRGPERGMLEGPRPETFVAPGDAVETVVDDPGYRRAAGRVVGAIDALPPLDAAVDALLAIARGVYHSGASGSPAESTMSA
jgi:UDP:flavonoid glycosyltransferase YjiC (YdhE family)